MPVNITMPALSPTMEEGNLAKWLVAEGDAVSPGDVIAEIETDKATMEVEAVEEGRVAKIVVPEGAEHVKVNAVIAVLAEEGEDADAVDGPVEEPVTPQTEQPAPKPADLQPPVAKKASTDDGHAHGKPDLAKDTSLAWGGEPSNGSPAEPSKRINGAKQEARNGERVFASPLARRIAKDRGIELAEVTGSGPRGRIVKADVEAFEPSAAPQADEAASPAPAPAASPAPAAGPAPSAQPRGMTDEQVLALFDDGAYEKKPHDGMRRTIAERLTQSSQTVPAYFVTVECELDALLALRKQMNDAAPERDGKPAYKISVNDFVVKALARALQDVPMANASWTSTDRILHRDSDVGVAVAVEDGLFTPIVRRAQDKTLSTISNEIKDLAGRARSRKLKPAEYQGGTTAVSNLGMFGVKEFTSIINPPHASILSVGAGEQRPVVRDGELAIATIMSATFAFDHRVIDGALGAELAAAFKRALEQPMSMLV